MDQIKAFISHSSDDALYVDVLINLIGKNSLVVDRFCFESGERTIDEIIKSIDNSAIFIVLLSRSSLDKDWVKKELAIIKKYIDSGVLKRFKPYIIDDTISYKYEKIPEWIKEEYNLRNIYIQPPFLARKIEEEVNKLIWEQCPDIRQDERVFVGRDTEIERLREKYLQRNLKDRKAVIVSGIPDGIGRRRLLTEFIRKIDTNKDETYDPFSVAMEEDDSIEDFIIQLNNLFFFERNEDLLQRISIINKTYLVKGSDRTYTCKLNSYGYVTEVTEDNDEKDGAIYYTLEYDKNGYLQRIEQRYSYNESRKRVSECTWRDGNLIESKLTDYYEDGTDITTVKYSYSKTTTPINIDLFYIDGGYIDVLEPLDLLGFYGRQSAKLPNKADITYSGESESESDDFGVYTLNGDGTVARIDCGSVSYELIY